MPNPSRVVRGYTARNRRGWYNRGTRACIRLKCVPSKKGQSKGCPTRQVKRCASFGRRK